MGERFSQPGSVTSLQLCWHFGISFQIKSNICQELCQEFSNHGLGLLHGAICFTLHA
ncbi:hypothetical protein T4A_13497 [Trichinella pseudospiralis]|uniref:Uncharacterized protein n=1 Tax=Trichinella pseudospiralis TaxID=6337 RepID=A0A0V1DKR7_TRIPS|nr:hypothetical protein T4A_13497 [Trichinella pseudospiralis]